MALAVPIAHPEAAPVLPPIPVTELGRAPWADLVDRFPDRLRPILDAAAASYGRRALVVGDMVTRAWSSHLPHEVHADIAAVAEAVGEPGAWLLNFSYEWGCTSAGVPNADGTPRLLRAMDWQLPSLGRTLIAVGREGAAGRWVNLGWPGFAGAVQGLAPGRFAAAINQAPGPRTPFGRVGDWVASKLAVLGSRGLPPVLALRTAFDTCRTFADACRHLIETPVCAPALYSVVGTKPGEGVLIERTPTRAVVHHGLPTVANHWLTEGMPGRSWSVLTVERLAWIRDHLKARRPGAAPFSWLAFPVLNDTTRLAFEACPASGLLIAQGYEADGPATAVLEMTA